MFQKYRFHLWWDPDLENECKRCGENGNLFAFHICDWKMDMEDMLNDRGLMGEVHHELFGFGRFVLGWRLLDLTVSTKSRFSPTACGRLIKTNSLDVSSKRIWNTFDLQYLCRHFAQGSKVSQGRLYKLYMVTPRLKCVR